MEGDPPKRQEVTTIVHVVHPVEPGRDDVYELI